MPAWSFRNPFLVLFLSLLAGLGKQGVLAQGQVSLQVLGNVQDAGSPHIACDRDCCRPLYDHPDPARRVVSLGLVDRAAGRAYLFEATPDLPAQWKQLLDLLPDEERITPDGIFLTHAHIGHYTGLMYLGREGLGARGVPVYAMPGMGAFLRANGPWSQLVELGNIALRPLAEGQAVSLTEAVRVTPLRVPHRDEFSETVGFRIDGPERSALFIPDIDKWSQWAKNVVEEVSRVDYALVDATFYDQNDIRHRDIAEIPHPFVIETMALFEDQPAAERAKIHFIHINHSNPLLDPASPASKAVEAAGFRVARPGMTLDL